MHPVSEATLFAFALADGLEGYAPAEAYVRDGFGIEYGDACAVQMPGAGMRVFVKDGRLDAEVHIGKNIRMTTGSISVDDIDIPEASVRGLKGKPVRSLIDHPFITDDMVITSVTLKGDGIRARIRMESHRVETSEIDAE